MHVQPMGKVPSINFTNSAHCLRASETHLEPKTMLTSDHFVARPARAAAKPLFLGHVTATANQAAAKPRHLPKAAQAVAGGAAAEHALAAGHSAEAVEAAAEAATGVEPEHDDLVPPAVTDAAAGAAGRRAFAALSAMADQTPAAPTSGRQAAIDLHEAEGGATRTTLHAAARAAWMEKYEHAMRLWLTGKVTSFTTHGSSSLRGAGGNHSLSSSPSGSIVGGRGGPSLRRSSAASSAAPSCSCTSGAERARTSDRGNAERPRIGAE